MDEEILELEDPAAMIKWARTQAGISQAQLARNCGMNSATVITWWETRKRRPSAENFISAINGCGFDVVLVPMEHNQE